MFQFDMENCYEIGKDYLTRFNNFRSIEAKFLNNPIIADEAFALLGDLERAYSARSYSACFCLACAMIEIHLRRIVKPKGGNISEMLKSVGLFEEFKWLVELRNAVMHGNPNPFIAYFHDPEIESEIEKKCINAFIALHTIAENLSANQYK